MIARSLEDNIPEPLAHVQAEAARRIGGTRPRWSLLDTRRDLITATGSRRWRCSGRLRGGIGEIGRRVVSGRADGNDRISLPWLLSGALSMTLWRLMAASRSPSKSAS